MILLLALKWWDSPNRTTLLFTRGIDKKNPDHFKRNQGFYPKINQKYFIVWLDFLVFLLQEKPHYANLHNKDQH